MKDEKKEIGIKEVQEFYEGAAGEFFDFLMFTEGEYGECLHYGGLENTDLIAEKTGLKSGMHILETCPYVANSSRYFAKKYGCQVTGVDITEKNVERARENVKRANMEDQITIVLGDAQDLKFEDASFDAVIGEDSWCHFSDKEAGVREAARVLRKGGKFGLTDFCFMGKGEPDEEMSAIQEGWSAPFFETVDNYVAHMRSNGVRVLEVNDLSPVLLNEYKRYLVDVIEKKDEIVKRWGEDMQTGAEGLIQIIIRKLEAGEFSKYFMVGIKQ
ncbi:MAG: methyltransferase domain-containing protein [Syntrophaceae bacterium]|nr:methyltransferase domain-containing protein [Syntrophaceae bacterium]